MTRDGDAYYILMNCADKSFSGCMRILKATVTEFKYLT